MTAMLDDQLRTVSALLRERPRAVGTPLRVRPGFGRARDDGPSVTGACIGRSDVLTTLLDAALDGERSEADGCLLVAAAWPGGPPAEAQRVVDELVADPLVNGRPVGIVVLGCDAQHSSGSLAWLRAAVTARGGFPVGAGLLVDESDALRSDGHRLDDVTVVSQLALLTRRIRDLASARTALRA